MLHRRALVAGALALCAATIVVPAAPASADTAPRLVKATVAASVFGISATKLTTTLRTTGDVARIDLDYAVTTGDIPTVHFTRSLPSPSAQVVDDVGNLIPPYAPSGAYHLTVTLVGVDGSTTTYRPDGTAQSCRVDHVCATAATGLSVITDPVFTRGVGPGTVSALLDGSGRVTSGQLISPASGASIAGGTTIHTDIGYATTGTPLATMSIFPVYGADSVAAFFAGPVASATGTSGTASSQGAGPTSGVLWTLSSYVVRTGLVDRVLSDRDRAYLHTTWPIGTTPNACGLVKGLNPSTACSTILDSGTVPSTIGGNFVISNPVQGWGTPYWTTVLSGGGVDTAAVASHTLTFIVHYVGAIDPAGRPISATVTGPGAGGLTVSNNAGTCPLNADANHECDLRIGVSGVQYNGVYTASSVSISLANSPTVTCSPGPAVRVTGLGLDDSLADQPARVASICGGIVWSHLTATVNTLSAPPCTDSAAPVLTAFSRTSATAFDGTNSPTTGTASFHWAATDAGCGLTRIAATFVRPDGVQWVANLNMSARASGSGTVDLTPAVGSWGVRDVAVYDAAGNVRHYDPSGVAAAVLAGAPKPYQRTKHSLDLGSAGVLANAGAPPAGVPAPPRALKVTPGGTSLAVSWAAPVPATGVTSYQVTVRSAVDGTSTTQAVTASTTNLTVTGLDPTTPYQVSVVALAGARVSPWTPLSRTITPAAQPVLEPPAAAPTLAALPVPLLSSTLPLSVTPQVVPGYPVTSHQVQWRYSGASAAFPASWTDKGAPPASPPTSITGLPAGAKVCVRVVPVNSAGRGPASNTRCTAVPLDERALTRSTGWTLATTAGAYRSTTTTSSTRGANLSLAAARGSGLVVLVRTRSGGGTLGVYVGTRRVATISTAGTSRTVAFTYGSAVTGNLTGQKITLKVETSGSPVSVDGLAVLP